MSNLKLNTKLVEEFGNLEQICNRNYNAKHGVTEYINEMESLSASGKRKPEGWYDSLKSLKTIRHKRNKLSHSEVSFSDELATKEDIKFLTNFQESLLNRTDPISLYKNPSKKPQKDGFGDAFDYFAVALLILAALVAAYLLLS